MVALKILVIIWAIMVPGESAVSGAGLDLPPLFGPDGAETVESWQTERRPEIRSLFENYVYGRAPEVTPEDLAFTVVEEDPGAMNGRATRRSVEIRYTGPHGTGSMLLHLFIPIHRNGPAPGFLLICHRDPENIDPTREQRTDFWPAEEIVARGYFAAAFDTEDLDPDYDDRFRNGVHGIFDSPTDETRPPDAWGTIAAWAWGAQRAMDYLVDAPGVDPQRVAVVGHSRGGKAALWAAAQDERFALCISNNSGCTGAALSRRREGETIRQINEQFPHWFCGNYKSFNDREYALPLDQHMLIASIAPRLVYVASASEDQWADPEGEFLAALHAAPAFRLFGLGGLEEASFPEPGEPIHDGPIGYHLRFGGHDMTAQDWQWFLDFADQHWKTRSHTTSKF